MRLLAFLSLLLFGCSPPVITNPKPTQMVYSPSILKPSKEEIASFEKKKEELREKFKSELEKEFSGIKRSKEEIEETELKPFLSNGSPF